MHFRTSKGVVLSLFHVCVSRLIQQLSFLWNRLTFDTLVVHSFVIFPSEFKSERWVHPNVHYMSGKDIVMFDWDNFIGSFLGFGKRCIGPIKSIEVFVFWSSIIFVFSFFFAFISYNSLRIEVCNGMWSSVLLVLLFFGNQNMLLYCFGLIDLTSSFRLVVRSKLHSAILLRFAMSAGLMNFDYSGLARDNAAICMFFWSCKVIWLCLLLWMLLSCCIWLKSEIYQ